ncbi:hypothetical protein Pan153_13240 [Gimesia panareensis]|uniref:Uncharacterized protein n=1 Tax=Gimesia panareensis TaxID=2527978 RepID=A0A518FK60_9PLAN|nr:hypothetical protein [Gimesia panareensis]QDV16693.1 hypothetical protein Pan153_13240 [Gimesia panareensis]
MVNKKTGLLLLALTGFSIPVWFHATNAEQQSTHPRQTTKRHQAVLQQIPPRVKLPSAQGEQAGETAETPSTKPAVISSDMISQLTSEEILQRLVGKWEQTKSTSKQILTIEENGKATMIVEPQGLWTTILGERVIIDIEWSLNQGKLTLRTVGGKPENKVDYINQLWGSEFVREIHSIEDKMFTLRDDSGEVNQKWIRTSY